MLAKSKNDTASRVDCCYWVNLVSHWIIFSLEQETWVSVSEFFDEGYRASFQGSGWNFLSVDELVLARNERASGERGLKRPGISRALCKRIIERYSSCRQGTIRDS